MFLNCLGYSIFKNNLLNISATSECNCLDVCTEISYKHNVVHTHCNFSKIYKYLLYIYQINDADYSKYYKKLFGLFVQGS